MGQLEDLRLFVRVVDAGSISKAADGMNIAKSAVSRRVALLEERYGAKLIDRSPGSWSVTDTGRELFQRAVRLVHEMDEIEGDFLSTASVIEGPLTVSLPHEFGVEFLYKTIIEFKVKHPQIQLTVEFDDRRVDLSRENFDLAIRITSGPETGLDAERIGTVKHGLFASRAYLEEGPEVNEIRNLREHQLLYYGSARRASWEFVSPSGKLEAFEFPPYLNSNSGVFLLESVKAGMGIARLPDFLVGDEDLNGSLTRVLPEAGIAEWGIYLVRPANRRVNRRMRLFSEELKRTCLLLPKRTC